MKNLKIGVRLGLGFGSMLLLVVLCAVLLWAGARVAESNLMVTNQGLADAVALADAQNALWQLRYGVSQFIAIPDPLSRQKIMNETSQWDGTVTSTLAKFQSGSRTLDEVAAARAVTEAYGKYINARPHWMELESAGKIGEAAAFRAKTILPWGADTVKAFSELIELQKKVSAENYATSMKKLERDRILTLFCLLAAVVCAAGFAWWLARSITRPILAAVGAAEALAQGDLTQKIEVKSKDETGQLQSALASMVRSLSQMVHGIKESSDTIDTAAKEIAQGNADLSQRTVEQAASLEETAASMEELTSTVKQNAENARQANQLAASASEVAAKGGKVVGQVVAVMGSINESSKKIADIIGVIDDIAFQTNILALNAAVEAARAGEQGRGFSVVASEVRNLAHRSAAAAKEIKALIGDSVDKVGTGTNLVETAGKAMEEIVTSVERVAGTIAEIAAASQQQSAGIEQVNTAITQMDEVTQQNSSMVEEAAAAAESMERQARVLIQSVAAFKLEQETQDFAARVAAPAPVKHLAGVALKPKRATVSEQHAGAEPVAARASASERQLPKPKLVAHAKADGGSGVMWREF